VANLGLIW